MNNYNFPVELTPIMTSTEKIIIPNRLAVYRPDIKQTIGVVSNNYELIKHSDVVDGFREALEGYVYEEEIKLMKEGAYLFMKYRMTDMKIDIGNGDILNLEFVVKNSYDGSNSLQIILGAFRLVCSNGLIIGKKLFNYTQKHIGSTTGIDSTIIKSKILMLQEQFEQILPHLQQMNDTKIEKDIDELFDAKRLWLPKYLSFEARESYQKNADGTVWGFYNALTAAITHKLKKDSPQAVINYGVRAWELAQMELN